MSREGGLLRAGEAVLVVEIASPGSRRTDRIIKRGEYADAGIPHYWIVDLDPTATLTACVLAAGLGYRDRPAATGRLRIDDPFSADLDLDALGSARSG